MATDGAPPSAIDTLVDEVRAAAAAREAACASAADAFAGAVLAAVARYGAAEAAEAGGGEGPRRLAGFEHQVRRRLAAGDGGAEG